MSEPMSSVEIEDVLSSIRRLVSEDLRPGAPARGPKLASDADAGAEKLILTPAHRIAGAEPAAPAAAAFHSVRVDAADAAAAIDVVVQSLSRAVDGQSAEWEGPQGDAPPVAERRWDDRAWAKHSHDPALGAEAGFTHVDDSADTGAKVTPMMRAAVVDDIPEPAVMPEPELVTPQPRFVADEAEDDEEDEAVAPPAAAQRAGQNSWQQSGDDAAPPPQPEFARPTPDRAWAEAAEAAVRQELDDQLGATVFADSFEHKSAATLDEDALRDLVREIIREELQGALGERITRNVRKLVRSEIARALAVRDFE